MKWLIDYIRSCICKHDWVGIRDTVVYEDEFSKRPIKTMRTYECSKCKAVKRRRI